MNSLHTERVRGKSYAEGVEQSRQVDRRPPLVQVFTATTTACDRALRQCEPPEEQASCHRSCLFRISRSL